MKKQLSTGSRWMRTVSMAALLMLVCGSAASALPGAAPRFGNDGTVKVRVTAANASLTAGGTVVATYESFTVVEMPVGAAPKADGVEILTEENFIKLNAGFLDTTKADIKKLQQDRGQFDGKALHLVQFAAAIQPGWYDQLVKTGVEIVTSIPSNAYLVYGDAAQIANLQGMAARMPEVQWDGAYKDEYRIDPAVLVTMNDPAKADATDQQFIIQLVKDAAANGQTLAVIDKIKSGAVVNSYDALNYHNVIAPIPPSQLRLLAAQPDVVSIQEYGTPIMLDERQDQIVAGNISGNVPAGPGYLAWLASKGFTQAQFTASGFAVDVSDSGIDNSTTSPNHFGLYVGGVRPGVSRIIYNRLEGTANGGSTLQGCDGHGNLNTHIVLGYDDLSNFPFQDASGYHYGLGVCPFTKAGSSVIFDPSLFTNPNFTTLQSAAYNNGARISTNSWGNTGGNTYNAFSQEYDGLVRYAQPAGSPFPVAGFQVMVFVFANGNSGTSSTATHAPATAKNVISVGAGENVQAFGGADASGIDDTGADNLNDIISFSSRGPTADGRKKPDICAPGTHVSGGVAQTASPSATGTHNPCFTGSGVSGGVAPSPYFPAGQEFYTASSGTSHSTPCVAGGAALVRQWFINQGMAPATPAMTKAILMNSARYMTGVGAGGNLWSTSQGMGEMDLGDLFDRGPTPTILRDELAADMFTASGQTRVFNGFISNASKPFRVTLAWTDAPGGTSGAAARNNLDLTVAVGANTFRGNVFTGANSVTGGAADALNNVESVFLPAGTTGAFTVTVTAANINSDGVPNNATSLDQDFALVVYNGGNGPANDLCANAIPYTVGSTASGTTTGATTDGAADCGSSLASPDVWYTMTPSCPGLLRLDTCGSSYDTVLSVHSACPGTIANELACNDDNITSLQGCPGIRDSALSLNVVGGTTYTIRVSGFNGLSGDFTLNSSYMNTGSDNCADAPTVPDGAYVFTNCTANTDGPTEGLCSFCCSDLQVNGDLWFRYVAASTGTVNVDTCGSVDPVFDTKIAVYAGGCPSGPDTAIACNDDACGAFGTLSATSFHSTAGQPYLIRVGGYATSRGQGTLTITGHSQCGSADFNCDGDLGTDSDIAAFFACLAGNCPPPPCTSTADFNGDGDIGTDSDIAAFFRVLSGGAC